MGHDTFLKTALPYQCKCGCKKIIEHTIGIYKTSNVDGISFDDRILGSNPVLHFEDTQTTGYFCADCEIPIRTKEGKRVKTEAELVIFLKETI